MHDRVTFSSFDPLFCETSEKCDVCHGHPPIFLFEAEIAGKRQGADGESGFCCGDCAARLLKKLARAESRQWAEEEAGLKREELDTAQIHERIVNSF